MATTATTATTNKTIQTMVKTSAALRVKGQSASKRAEILSHSLDYNGFKLVKVPKWGGYAMTVATVDGDVNLMAMVNSLTQLAYELTKYNENRFENNLVIKQGRKVIATCTKGCVNGKMEWEFTMRFMSFIAR